MKSIKTEHITKITHNNIDYEIKTKNLVYVLRLLLGDREAEINDDQKIVELMKEFKLYDKDFLEAISKL